MSEDLSDSARQECPNCGATIPEGAPQGLCPKCVLLGVATGQDSHPSFASAPTVDSPSLQRVRDAFPQLEILELIGQGGMGTVYKARQVKLDRTVALKILAADKRESPDFAERFNREGRVLAKLNHPNIVGVHDFGEANGFHYLIMEYVDGVNLRQAMRTGRFTPAEALAIVPTICDALQYAHEAGILHRDIKPENILLDTNGKVKIVDFGIAKLLDSAGPDQITLTKTVIPGTPQYMAPEQFESPSDIDHRADIYSLGVVIYELLTGELPMGRFAAPSEKAAVDARIDEIVFRTLEKERSMRQQSAAQVRTEVEGAKGGVTEPKPSTTEPRSSKSFAGLHPSPVQLIRKANRSLLLLTFAVVAAGFSLLSLHSVTVSEMKTESRLAQIDSLKSVIAQSEEKLRDATAIPGSDLRVIEEDLNRRRQELAMVVQSASTEVSSVDSMMIKVASGLSLAVVFGLVVASITTGWSALIELRSTGIRQGRISAGISAMLIPLALLNVGVFLFIVLPYNWQGPAIPFAGVLCMVVDFLLIQKLVRWISSGPEARYADLSGDDSRISFWWFLIVGLLVGFTIAIYSSIVYGGVTTLAILGIIAASVIFSVLVFIASRSVLSLIVTVIIVLILLVVILFAGSNRASVPNTIAVEPSHASSPNEVVKVIPVPATEKSTDDPDEPMKLRVIGEQDYQVQISTILDLGGRQIEIDDFRCTLGSNERSFSTNLRWSPGPMPGSIEFSGIRNLAEGNMVREFWTEEMGQADWKPMRFELGFGFSKAGDQRTIILFQASLRDGTVLGIYAKFSVSKIDDDG